MSITLHLGDCLEILPTLEAGSVQCCVTSPPYYGLRDYGVSGQIGLEETPEAYVDKLVQVFREVRRVLADDGTLWLNLGDSYKARNLLGIPWRVAFALQDDGWYLRSEVIWHKPNPMPESVKDRPTKAHEQIFLLSKNAQYFYDADAVKEPAASSTLERDKYSRGNYTKDVNDGFVNRINPDINGGFRNHEAGRNRRDVWTVTTKPYKGAHFATFPPDLIEPCILAGSRPGDIVLDPFNGSGTTVSVAVKHGRNGIGIELNPVYIELTNKRLEGAKMVMPL